MTTKFGMSPADRERLGEVIETKESKLPHIKVAKWLKKNGMKNDRDNSWEKGQYVKYNYLDLKTGKETSKYSLILKSDSSKKHLFIIPLKNNKSMIVKDEKEDRKIKIYDKDKKKEISF